MEAPRIRLVEMTASRLSFLFFMLLCVAGLCSLGVWQVKRLHWKEGLIAQLDAAYAHDPAPPFVTGDQIRALTPDHFLRGMFRGHLDFSKAFLLQGQIDKDALSSHTIVPCVVSPDLTILVDFGPGFTTKDKDNAATVLTGLLRPVPKTNAFTPANDPAQKSWYSLDPAQLDIKNLAPLEILPEHTPWKDYPSARPELRNAHLQYAIFWFTMALIVLVLTGYYLRSAKT